MTDNNAEQATTRYEQLRLGRSKKQTIEQDDQAQKYLKNFSGHAVKKTVVLSSPPIERLLRRYFYITSRNLYFITIRLREHLSADAVAEAEQQCRKLFEGLFEEVQTVRNQMQQLLDQNGITDIAEPVHPLEREVAITSQLSGTHLELHRSADEVAGMIETLAISGAIEASSATTRNGS